MKNYVVIGLGNFGMNIAKTLVEHDCEVLGIDSEKENVQKAMDFITHAIVGDASNRSVLRALAVKDFDAAIVSIGQEMGASILISMYLKELEIPKIIVRAISEDHEKILEQLGVDDIIFPEKDMAIKLGKILSMKNTLDYLPLSEDYLIMEIEAPKSFIGKTLMELQITKKYNCQVLGIKYPETKENGAHVSDSAYNTKMAPSGEDSVPEKSILIVIGKNTDIEGLQKVK